MASGTGVPASQPESKEERRRRERLNNTYRWSDEYNALVLPNAAPNDFGGSLGFKKHEPFPMKFIHSDSGATAELGRNGTVRGAFGSDPLFGKLFEFYSMPIPEKKIEGVERPVPTELEMMAGLAGVNRKGAAMTAANGGRERMVVLMDGGSPVLSLHASCVYFSDNQNWVVAGTRNSIDLSKLTVGGKYVMAVVNPGDDESRTMKVINFGISMPNPMGGGAYAVFGIEKEEAGDDGEDWTGSDEDLENNASFL